MSLSRLKKLAEYSCNAVIMLNVQADIRGLILGLKEEQRRISSSQRLEKYEEALMIIKEDPSRIPKGYQYQDLHDLVINIATGSEVTPDRAEIAAGTFRDYNRYFLERYSKVEGGIF